MPRAREQLLVEARDGRATRFYVLLGGQAIQRSVAQVVGPPLERMRFDCAMQLECGQVEGPSTLATQ